LPFSSFFAWFFPPFLNGKNKKGRKPGKKNRVLDANLVETKGHDRMTPNEFDPVHSIMIKHTIDMKLARSLLITSNGSNEPSHFPHDYYYLIKWLLGFKEGQSVKLQELIFSMWSSEHGRDCNAPKLAK
jgi:hypothetical protein